MEAKRIRNQESGFRLLEWGKFETRWNASLPDGAGRIGVLRSGERQLSVERDGFGQVEGWIADSGWSSKEWGLEGVSLHRKQGALTGRKKRRGGERWEGGGLRSAELRVERNLGRGGTRPYRMGTGRIGVRRSGGRKLRELSKEMQKEIK